MTTQEQQPAQPAQPPASRPATLAASAEPVAFYKDGVLFWHGEHAAWRGKDGELYAGPPAPSERAPVAPKAKQCVACEGAPSGDNIPCAVCGADPAPPASENPLSDEYVNAVIRRHGYDSPECVIARLHQWIGLHGGENGVTLLMYEAHKALVKLRTPVADERAAFKKCHAAIIKAISSIARADGPDTRKEDDPELLYRSPVMDEVVRIRGALDEYSAALASAPVAGEAQPVIHQHGFAADNQRLRAINESLDKQLEEVMTERDEYHDMADKLADAIADHLLVEIGEHSSSNCPWMRALEAIESAAPQASPAADGRDAKDAARYRWLRSLESFREHDDWTIYDGGGSAARGEALDAAIDATIAAQQDEGGGV